MELRHQGMDCLRLSPASCRTSEAGAPLLTHHMCYCLWMAPGRWCLMLFQHIQSLQFDGDDTDWRPGRETALSKRMWKGCVQLLRLHGPAAPLGPHPAAALSPLPAIVQLGVLFPACRLWDAAAAISCAVTLYAQNDNGLQLGDEASSALKAGPKGSRAMRFAHFLVCIIVASAPAVPSMGALILCWLRPCRPCSLSSSSHT